MRTHTRQTPNENRRNRDRPGDPAPRRHDSALHAYTRKILLILYIFMYIVHAHGYTHNHAVLYARREARTIILNVRGTV